MIKKGLTVGIIVLFIASSLTPMAIGNNSEPTELDKQLANLAFIYREPNSFNSTNYEYYKQQLIKQYPFEDFEDSYNDNIVETENTVAQIESKVKPLFFNQVSNGPMDSAWPMQNHDVHHTGLSPYSTADNPGTEKWRFYTDGWIEDTPIIDSDGTIYFGQGWDLFAIHPDGSLKWKYRANDLIMGSSPAIAEDGTIYIGSWDTKLYAINPNGTQKWDVGTGDIVASSPAIANDGTIYVGNYGSKIVAVNPNGTIKWEYNTDGDIISDPAIGDDGTIYVGSLGSYLYAMNPNGTLKWKFKTGDRIYGSPSIADEGTIYIGSSWDSYLYALYPNSTLKWKYGGAGTPNNPSIGSDGTIYSGYLYNFVALNPDGTLKWVFYVGDVGYIGKSAPAISADGTIYFGIHLGTPGYSNGGEIIALNPDGTERWRKRIADKWVESSPSIAEDGTVYIGSADTIASGYLHAFGSIESNGPPDAPTISGPTHGKAGVEYKYIFTAVDPDRNPISLYIDWGDGTNTSWTREYASEEQVKVKHTFADQGTFTIGAKAKDVMGAESEWGYLEVTMPLELQISQSSNQQISQQSSNQLILKMFQRLLLNIR